MEYGGGDDLDSFMFNDATTAGITPTTDAAIADAQRTPTAGLPWKVDSEDSDSRHPRRDCTGTEGKGGSGHYERRSSGENDRHGKKPMVKKGRRADEGDMDAILASSDEGSDVTTNGNATSGKRQSRLKPRATANFHHIDQNTRQSAPNATPAPGDHSEQRDEGCIQKGSKVEARYGGKSKWYTGEIQKVYESPGGFLYDIAYDDGDEDQRVIAGRVRRPGQPPPILEAGLSVDVKLARKGKGYHPGTIGRVNDDGTLYVKLDDGDAEWSVPVRNAIASYAYAPPTAPPAHDSLSPQNTREPENDGDTPRGKCIPESRNRSEIIADTEVQKPSTSTPKKEGDTQAEDPGEGRATGVRVSEPWVKPISTSPVPDEIDWISQAAGGVKRIATSPNATKSQSLRRTPSTAVGNAPAGLGWITEVANSVTSVGSPVSSFGVAKAGTMQGGVNLRDRSISPLPSSAFVPVSRCAPIASQATPTEGETCGQVSVANGTAVVTTPQALPVPQPRSLTPAHLEWKPLTNASANRRWGAPPPDEPEESGLNIMSNGPGIPNPVSGNASAVRIAPIATRTSRSGGAAGGTGVSSTLISTTSAVHVSSTLVASVSLPNPSEGRSADSGEKDKEGGDIPRYHTSGDGECSRSSSQKASRPTDDKEGLKGEQQATETGGSANSVLPLVAREKGGEAATIPILKGEGEDSGKSILWGTLRSSVQRRYAAEAMHLSEEVRLLKAKLKGADEKTGDKLLQQERRLRKHFAFELKSEKAKMDRMIESERIAGTRKVRVLRNELDTMKRRLDEEKARNSKIIAAGSGGTRVSPLPSSNRQSRRTQQLPRSKPRSTSSDTAPWSTSLSNDNRLRSRETQPKTKSLHKRPPSIASGSYHTYPPPLPHLNGFGSDSSKDPDFSAQRFDEVAADGTRSEDAISQSAGVVRGKDALLERVVEVLVKSVASRDDVIRDLTSRMRLLETSTRTHSGDQRGLLEELEAPEPKKAWTAPRASKGCNGIEGLPPAPNKEKRPERLETRSAVLDHYGAGIDRESREQIEKKRYPSCSHRNNGQQRDQGPQSKIDNIDSGERPSTQAAETTNFVNDRVISRNSDTDKLAQRFDNVGIVDENIRWQIETERRDMRHRLEAMKGEVDRVVGHFKGRAERAEARADSADERARLKAVRYLEESRASRGSAGRLAWSGPSQK